MFMYVGKRWGGYYQLIESSNTLCVQFQTSEVLEVWRSYHCFEKKNPMLIKKKIITLVIQYGGDISLSRLYTRLRLVKILTRVLVNYLPMLNADLCNKYVCMYMYSQLQCSERHSTEFFLKSIQVNRAVLFCVLIIDVGPHATYTIMIFIFL